MAALGQDLQLWNSAATGRGTEGSIPPYSERSSQRTVTEETNANHRTPFPLTVKSLLGNNGSCLSWSFYAVKNTMTKTTSGGQGLFGLRTYIAVFLFYFIILQPDTSPLTPLH